MITSWERMKQLLTAGYTPGSSGYMVMLNKASDVFIAISHRLKDHRASEKAFNTDAEVTAALVQRGHLKEMGLLRE